MGQLNEQTFPATVGACTSCATTKLEVRCYLDRTVPVMLGDANDAGRWAYDGEKFIDGCFSIKCVGCGHQQFRSDDCPRCHAEGTLAASLQAMSRLTIPKRCPQCTNTEITVTGFAPAAVVVTGPGRPPAPKPTALAGEEGFHAAILMCDECDWVAIAEGCPLCGAAGPLRKRP